MTTNATTAQSATSGRPKVTRKQSYFPPQHGGWAFIGLPIVLGFVVAPWSPLLLLTAIASLAAFPLSHFVTATIRYSHKARYRKPLILWACLCVPAALVLLFARPWLVWVGLAYVAALAINITLARNSRERSMANDLVFIGECVALIPIMWAIGTSSGGWTPASSELASAPASVWAVTCLAALLLIDSTLHIKSLIRERNNPRYQWMSRAWSIFSLGFAIVLSLLVGWPAIVVAVPFAFLIVRSYALADRELKPGVLGVVELGAVLLLVGAMLVSGA